MSFKGPRSLRGTQTIACDPWPGEREREREREGKEGHPPWTCLWWATSSRYDHWKRMFHNEGQFKMYLFWDGWSNLDFPGSETWIMVKLQKTEGKIICRKKQIFFGSIPCLQMPETRYFQLFDVHPENAIYACLCSSVLIGAYLWFYKHFWFSIKPNDRVMLCLIMVIWYWAHQKKIWIYFLILQKYQRPVSSQYNHFPPKCNHLWNKLKFVCVFCCCWLDYFMCFFCSFVHLWHNETKKTF